MTSIFDELEDFSDEQLSELIARCGRAISQRAEDLRHFENEQYVGKCYCYRNSYSCPRNAKDYWSLYQRVMALDDDGNPWGVSIQIDCDGKMECDEGVLRSLGEEIELSEFEKAAEEFRKKVAFRLS